MFLFLGITYGIGRQSYLEGIEEEERPARLQRRAEKAETLAKEKKIQSDKDISFFSEMFLGPGGAKKAPPVTEEPVKKVEGESEEKKDEEKKEKAA